MESGFEAAAQFIDHLVDDGREGCDGALGEVARDVAAAHAVVVVVDCSDEREGCAEGDGVPGVSGSLARARCVDLIVVVWVFDVEFSWVDSDNRTWPRVSGSHGRGPGLIYVVEDIYAPYFSCMRSISQMYMPFFTTS